MTTNQCVAVAVLYPWRWLWISVSVAALLVSSYTLWSIKRQARDLARHSERFADALETLGQFDQAAEMTRATVMWRRRAWPLRVPRASAAGGGDPR